MNFNIFAIFLVVLFGVSTGNSLIVVFHHIFLVLSVVIKKITISPSGHVLYCNYHHKFDGDAICYLTCMRNHNIKVGYCKERPDGTYGCVCEPKPTAWYLNCIIIAFKFVKDNSTR